MVVLTYSEIMVVNKNGWYIDCLNPLKITNAKNGDIKYGSEAENTVAIILKEHNDKV